MRTLANAPATLPQANDACWCGSGRKYKRCHKRSEGRVLPGVVSPMRDVPAGIGRPPYADTGHPVPWDEPRVKSPEVIARMRRAGAVAAEILRLAGEAVQPGMTTDDLDVLVHELHIERSAYPSPLNYNGFPKSVCTSANEVICHGIPDSRVLQDGDILNLDVTSYVDGVHGDTNATFLVGDVDPVSRRLVAVTEECMWHGIEAVRPGRPLSDIGRAIEDHAKAHRYGVVRAFIGHSIGEQFHGDIQVLHYYDSRASLVMRPGMTFTIEPMISLGTWQHKMWDDDWTAVTADGKRTAQFEHTVLVTDDGFDVLTGGPRRGVAVGPVGPLTGGPALVALVTLALVGCGGDGSDDGLAIDGAWARTTPAGVDVGAVYLQVTSPVADELVGAAVDPAVAGSVQLHRTTVDGAGTATMAEQPSLPVPAGGTLVLEPLGDHLMLVDLAGPLTPDASFGLTLRFAAAGDVAVEVVVRDRAP